MIATVFFYIFAVVLLISAAMVVSSRNPVHSVLFLILSFFNAAALFLIAGAEFLAMILMIVYVGAVAVLFLFVVMMLDINFTALRRGLKQHLALGLSVGVVLLAELIIVVGAWAVAPAVASHTAPVVAPLVTATNTQALGSILYTRYIYAFEASGLILLVAMIGAIVLTLRSRVGVRRQAIASQIGRSRAETIEVVKVPTGHGI
ncbi:MAG TPA: NADH-quinone oxidoreductase subunit J [Aliidongia sp.]|nr:NADH-quinone oxidoreductase subunit J [Aliidongia sp.]